MLFASIILYSLGSIANGMVHTLGQYELARFVTGLGLAGELGAGITLVSELMPKERRGIATSLGRGDRVERGGVCLFCQGLVCERER